MAKPYNHHSSVQGECPFWPQSHSHWTEDGQITGFSNMNGIMYVQGFVGTWSSHLYELVGHLIPKPWALLLSSPHQAPNSLHSSRKILELSLWNLGLFSLRSPALQSTFQIIPRVFGRLGVRPLWLRPLEFLHTKLIKRCLYEAGFVHKGTVMLQQKRTYPKLVPQGWKYRIV